MQPETLISILLSAAAFLKEPMRTVAAQSVKDIYGTIKYYLRRKFGESSDGAKALDLATEKPESLMRKGMLVEETAAANLQNDPDLIRLIEQLASALPDSLPAVRATVRVTGRNNSVQMAGRDIVTTARYVQRTSIKPDERHIDGAQKRQLGAVIAEIADRLAGDDGKPRFGAVHAMLQRKFNVGAFALLPREQFDDAMSFLKQQRAIHRSRLRHRNPAAYQQDFLRTIHSCRAELGWDKPQLYQFAAEKLGLKKPITSLQELGSIQLKSLAESLHRQTASAEP